MLDSLDPIQSIQSKLIEHVCATANGWNISPHSFQTSLSYWGDYLNVQVHVCIGGKRVSDDIHTFEAGVQIVSGTPGRVFHMIQHLGQLMMEGWNGIAQEPEETAHLEYNQGWECACSSCTSNLSTECILVIMWDVWCSSMNCHKSSRYDARSQYKLLNTGHSRCTW